jgi:hypothetical protein
MRTKATEFYLVRYYVHSRVGLVQMRGNIEMTLREMGCDLLYWIRSVQDRY